MRPEPFLPHKHSSPNWEGAAPPPHISAFPVSWPSLVGPADSARGCHPSYDRCYRRLSRPPSGRYCVQYACGGPTDPGECIPSSRGLHSRLPRGSSPSHLSLRGTGTGACLSFLEVFPHTSVGLLAEFCRIQFLRPSRTKNQGPSRPLLGPSSTQNLVW